MITKKEPILGAHLSISQGLANAIKIGEDIGCTAIQIFTKSNRQWLAKALTDEAVKNFKTSWKNSSIQSIIVHACYLINLGSEKKELQEKSIKSLTIELERCQALEIPYLVLHPGTYANDMIEESLQQIAENIDIAIEKANSSTMILLETMAGQGKTTCFTFEHIASIIKYSHHKKRLGVCLDTCHVFAAGYDFCDKKKYHTFWKSFDAIIGQDKLHAIHLNDSKTACGSRVDRHENIGKGKIGLEAFTLIMNDPALLHIPKILETPYSTAQDHMHNIKILKNLISE